MCFNFFVAALHSACYFGHARITALLIQLGADINAACTPTCRQSSHIPSTSVNSFCGATPLHFACIQGHFKIVRLLLSRGADHSLRDERNCLPVDVARLHGRKTCAELLEKFRKNYSSTTRKKKDLDQELEWQESFEHLLLLELENRLAVHVEMAAQSTHRSSVVSSQSTQSNRSTLTTVTSSSMVREEEWLCRFKLQQESGVQLNVSVVSSSSLKQTKRFRFTAELKYQFRRLRHSFSKTSDQFQSPRELACFLSTAQDTEVPLK